MIKKLGAPLRRHSWRHRRAERTIGDVIWLPCRGRRESVRLAVTRKSPSYSYQHEHRIMLISYGLAVGLLGSWVPLSALREFFRIYEQVDTRRRALMLKQSKTRWQEEFERKALAPI